MTSAEQLFRTIGEALPGVTLSQMFGKPCLKKEGKAFACLFGNHMVFKVAGQTHRDALALPGACLFDPSGKGRPMKQWVQVPEDLQNQWKELASAALAESSSL